MIAKIGVCTLIAFSAINAKAIDLSFNTLTEFVSAKNARVAGYKEKLRAEKMKQNSLGRSFLPEVSLKAGYESFNIRSNVSKTQPYYGIEGEINIYNGGRDLLEERIQNSVVAKSEAETKIVTSEELLRARELYWKIVFLEEENKLLKKMNVLNERNLNSANKRIRSGVATASDRIEFEMKRIDLEREIAFTKNEQKALLLELRPILGFTPQQSINIAETLDHADEWETELKHVHEDHSFQTEPTRLSAEKFGIEQKKAKRYWTPKIDVYAGWQQFSQREEAEELFASNRQEAVVGIRLKMNLFDGLSSTRDSQVLGARRSAAENFVSYHRELTEGLIERDFLRMRNLHDQVHESDKHIDLAERYHRATQSEYTRGAKNSPDVLAASERLEDVIRTKNRILRDFHIARSRVLSRTGR